MNAKELQKMADDYQFRKATFIAKTCSNNVTFCGLTDYVSKDVQNELLDIMELIYDHAYRQAVNDCIKISED